MVRYEENKINHIIITFDSEHTYYSISQRLQKIRYCLHKDNIMDSMLQFESVAGKDDKAWNVEKKWKKKKTQIMHYLSATGVSILQIAGAQALEEFLKNRMHIKGL